MPTLDQSVLMIIGANDIAMRLGPNASAVIPLMGAAAKAPDMYRH